MSDFDYKKLLDSIKSDFNEFPTAKQINFAKDIAEVLDLKLPEEKTKAAYSKFIDSNVGQYREAIDEANDNHYWFEELGG